MPFSEPHQHLKSKTLYIHHPSATLSHEASFTGLGLSSLLDCKHLEDQDPGPQDIYTLMFSAHARCWIKLTWYYHLLELTKKKFFKMHPFLLAWVRCQSLFKTQVQSKSTQILRAKPLQGCFWGSHVCRAHTCLTSKQRWVCDISTAGSGRVSYSITVFDTCNESHLFFLSKCVFFGGGQLKFEFAYDISWAFNSR